jgi:heat shock protein HtpX
MAAGLQTSIWNNNIRSVLLLAAYPFILMGIVWAAAAGGTYAHFLSIGGYSPHTYGHVSGPDPNTAVFVANGLIVQFWPIILAVVGIWFVISYFWHSSMINALSHAQPVLRTQEPELYNLLENLCIAEGMTMPTLNIIETPARNAFASGIDDRSYSVTVTRGLIDSLSKDELEAVLAHELTHIVNRDVRLLMVTVIFTGMVGFAAQLCWSSLRHGLRYRGGRNGKGGGGILIVIAVGIILYIGYIATLFMRFALSRRREFMADAGAVQMTKNPEAMMRALMKISGLANIPNTPGDIDMMCIENAQPFLGLFATHPPIESRIRVIAEMTNMPVPALPEPAKAALSPTVQRNNEEARKNREKIHKSNPWLRRGRE